MSVSEVSEACWSLEAPVHTWSGNGDDSGFSSGQSEQLVQYEKQLKVKEEAQRLESQMQKPEAQTQRSPELIRQPTRSQESVHDESPELALLQSFQGAAPEIL
jgi:hypothetical protein